MQRLFVYGTLIDPAVCRVILGSTAARLRVRPAGLPGYRRVAAWGRTYPFLREEPGQVVRGSVLEGLSRAALRRLARYEGHEYRLARCLVDLDEGVAPALVFLARRPVPDGPEWCYECWGRKHRARLQRRLRRRGGID